MFASFCRLVARQVIHCQYHIGKIVCLASGVKASNYFMPTECTTERGPGGNISFNQFVLCIWLLLLLVNCDVRFAIWETGELALTGLMSRCRFWVGAEVLSAPSRQACCVRLRFLLHAVMACRPPHAFRWFNFRSAYAAAGAQPVPCWQVSRREWGPAIYVGWRRAIVFCFFDVLARVFPRHFSLVFFALWLFFAFVVFVFSSLCFFGKCRGRCVVSKNSCERLRELKRPLINEL